METDVFTIPHLESRLNQVGISLAKAAREAKVDWRTAKRAADGDPIRRLSYTKLLQYLESKEQLLAEENVLQLNGSRWTSLDQPTSRAAFTPLIQSEHIESEGPEKLIEMSVGHYRELVKIYAQLEEFYFTNPKTLEAIYLEEHNHYHNKAVRSREEFVALITGSKPRIE